MKRMRGTTALAAVSLIVGITATARASGSGDAQGPKPFAACADIATHGFSVAGQSGGTEWQFVENGPSDPGNDEPGGVIDDEPGEVYRTPTYVTDVRVDIELVNNPCAGSDGVWGTADDRVSFSAVLLHPEQDGDNWTATEITDATLTETTYADNLLTEDPALVSFTYKLDDPQIDFWTYRTRDPLATDGYAYRDEGDGPDVCGEARSVINLGRGFLSDVSPDLDADGSRVFTTSDPEKPTILGFCEETAGAGSKAG